MSRFELSKNPSETEKQTLFQRGSEAGNDPSPDGLLLAWLPPQPLRFPLQLPTMEGAPAAGGASTPPKPAKRAAPPSSPPSAQKTFSRPSNGLHHAMQELDQAIAAQSQPEFVTKVQNMTHRIVEQFGQWEVDLLDHSTGLEAHQLSFASAMKAVRDLKMRLGKVETDLDTNMTTSGTLDEDRVKTLSIEAAQPLSQQIANQNRYLEEIRNKILNIEHKAKVDMETMTYELKEKFKASENFDEKLKVTMEHTIRDTLNSQKVLELVAQHLQGQEAGFNTFKAELAGTVAQLQGQGAQLSTFQHDQLLMEAELGRLAREVASWSTGDGAWDATPSQSPPAAAAPPGFDPWADARARAPPSEPAQAPTGTANVPAKPSLTVASGTGPTQGSGAAPPTEPIPASLLHPSQAPLFAQPPGVSSSQSHSSQCGQAEPAQAYPSGFAQPHGLQNGRTEPSQAYPSLFAHPDGSVWGHPQPVGAYSHAAGAQPQFYEIHTPKSESWSRFSEKVAALPQYQYDGEKGGAALPQHSRSANTSYRGLLKCSSC